MKTDKLQRRIKRILKPYLDVAGPDRYGGMALCERAAELLGENYEEAPWNWGK